VTVNVDVATPSLPFPPLSPFNSRLKWMKTIHAPVPAVSEELEDQRRLAVLKGAPEIILKSCSRYLSKGEACGAGPRVACGGGAGVVKPAAYIIDDDDEGADHHSMRAMRMGPVTPLPSLQAKSCPSTPTSCRTSRTCTRRSPARASACWASLACALTL
jgi:hypothetical protein